MKFELKTENDNFSKSYLFLFSSLAVFLILIILANLTLKLSNISRHYEINYLCRLLVVEKSSFNFKKLSKLSNQTSKQKIWELCKEIVK